MKKPLLIASLIIVFIVIAALHFSSGEEAEISPSIASALPNETFILASSDPEGKVLAVGDVNGDGYADAIVQAIQCGASCSVSLDLVLNDKDKAAVLFEPKTDAFAPAFNPSGAMKSSVSGILIDNEGIISITGKGLACGNDCTESKWNTVKTIKYRFDGDSIIQITPTREAEIAPALTKPKPLPPAAPAKPAAKCYVGGCSSQLCSDQPDMASTCEWTESYACYKTATCERQANGSCGWTQTAELQACVSSAR